MSTKKDTVLARFLIGRRADGFDGLTGSTISAIQNVQHFESSERSECLKRLAMSERGFTLVEILISVVILSIGVFALINMFTVGMKGILANEKRTVATNLAQDLMDEIFNKHWKDPDLEGDYPDLGSDGNELELRALYDDIDDYYSYYKDNFKYPPYDVLGTELTIYAGFSRMAEVYYVSPINLDTKVVGPTNLKKITVTVKEDSIADVVIKTIRARPWAD